MPLRLILIVILVTNPDPKCWANSDSVRSSQTTPRLSIAVSDAARTSGFSENYIRLLIHRRLLPHVRVGRAVRVMV
jgi:hypothetical protein